MLKVQEKIMSNSEHSRALLCLVHHLEVVKYPRGYNNTTVQVREA